MLQKIKSSVFYEKIKTKIQEIVNDFNQEFFLTKEKQQP